MITWLENPFCAGPLAFPQPVAILPSLVMLKYVTHKRDIFKYNSMSLFHTLMNSYFRFLSLKYILWSKKYMYFR